ncbi:2296_t:CDS:2 [Rhizophagus irregularis]|nr:2296_t:CDS:2 [Rhizophagus irregularis]
MSLTNPEDIKVPFPPQIKAEDILEKRRQNRKSAKSPNAFFIYRIAYLDQLRLHNFRVKMTDMSGYVSASWKKEPSNVKATYKDLARKVERLVIEARQKALAQRSQPPEPNNYFDNNNQISPTLSSDDNNLSPAFEDIQLPSINRLEGEQPSFNLYNNYNNGINLDNMFY